MTALDYMKDLENEVEKAKWRVEELTAVAEGVKARVTDSVNVGKCEYKHYDSHITALIEAKDEYKARLEEYADYRNWLFQLMMKFEDPKAMTVLHKRHFNHQTMKEIAKEMGCSESLLRKYHAKGIKELNALLTANPPMQI